MKLVSKNLASNLEIKKDICLMQSYTDTGSPKKHETLETTVLNVYCLFPYIHDSMQLLTCLVLCKLDKSQYLRQKI